jgi:CBS domain-containing protein
MTRYLRDWSVADYIREERRQFHLEYVEEDDTVLTILEKMKKFGISSLPIRETRTGKFTGIIDVVSIQTIERDSLVGICRITQIDTTIDSL